MNAAAVSEAGLALIQDYEGFRAEPAQLPDGAWLVGYGHVRAEAGEPVNEAQAMNLLSADLAPVAALVSAKVAKPLTQSQFDALVSFAFSIGAEAFERSQVLRRVNAGEFVAAACAMDAWRKSDASGEPEVFAALIARRAAEKVMFLQDMPRRTAPSALLRAQLDHAASILGAPVRFAAAPEIASPQVVAASPEATAPVGESSNFQASAPLLLTQVVANDVDGDFAAANDAAADAADDAANDATRAATNDAANDAANDATNDETNDATRAAANDARPVHTIAFVELPIDRRIRDGRKGGFANGLKALWEVLRSPKAEQA